MSTTRLPAPGAPLRNVAVSANANGGLSEDHVLADDTQTGLRAAESDTKVNMPRVIAAAQAAELKLSAEDILLLKFADRFVEGHIPLKASARLIAVAGGKIAPSGTDPAPYKSIVQEARNQGNGPSTLFEGDLAKLSSGQTGHDADVIGRIRAAPMRYMLEALRMTARDLKIARADEKLGFMKLLQRIINNITIITAKTT